MIAAILVAICVAAILAFGPILKQRNEDSVRIAQLRAEIAKQTALLARRTREVNLLKNDPEYVAMIAHDRLDMMKPGETIVRLEQGRASERSVSGSASSN